MWVETRQKRNGAMDGLCGFTTRRFVHMSKLVLLTHSQLRFIPADTNTRLNADNFGPSLH
jgi:hypothetical protein